MDNNASHIPANAEQFKIKDFTAFLYKGILGICLPPNTMSVMQPLDQGIIACLKRKWRVVAAGEGGAGAGYAWLAGFSKYEAGYVVGAGCTEGHS